MGDETFEKPGHAVPVHGAENHESERYARERAGDIHIACRRGEAGNQAHEIHRNNEKEETAK